MTDRNERPRRAQGRRATGAIKNAAGSGVEKESSTGRAVSPPMPLIVERGAVRRASLAELRRLARLGLREVLA